MHLEKILPLKALQLNWHQVRPYNPANAPFTNPRSTQSFQGWIALGALGTLPGYTEVHAQAPLGDGTRGVLTLWTPWAKGFSSIAIAILETPTDPIPPAYNDAAHGFNYVTASAAEPASGVAGALASAIGTILGASGNLAAYFASAGAITPNLARADLGDGSVAFVSPRPWLGIQLASVSGAWGSAANYVEHQTIVRPRLLAGLRPAPWLVVGEEFSGIGARHSVIG